MKRSVSTHKDCNSYRFSPRMMLCQPKRSTMLPKKSLTASKIYSSQNNQSRWTLCQCTTRQWWSLKLPRWPKRRRSPMKKSATNCCWGNSQRFKSKAKRTKSVRCWNTFFWKPSLMRKPRKTRRPRPRKIFLRLKGTFKPRTRDWTTKRICKKKSSLILRRDTRS